MYSSTSLIPLVVVVILIVISLFTQINGAPNCPSKCKCNETAIRCVEKQLEVIPDFKKIVSIPTIIDLSDNNIEEVKRIYFFTKRLEMVEKLYLNDNSILSIELTAFVTLPSLQYLELSNNLLDDIPSDVIRKNSKLTELNLSGNLFGSKTPQLVSKSLQVLDLSFSKVSTFTEDNLKGLPNLQALYLHANSLQHVDYNIFVDVNLKHVDLAFNCWKCNCDTIKLFDYLVKSEMTQVDSPIQCMHPNKWYQDIYNSRGPMHDNELCKKKAHHTHHAHPAADAPKSEVVHTHHVERAKEEAAVEADFTFVVEYEILIAVGIIAVLVVVSLISLTVVMRRTKPVKQPIYEELQNVSIQSKLTSDVFAQK